MCILRALICFKKRRIEQSYIKYFKKERKTKMLQQLDFASDLAIAKAAGEISKGATHASMLKDWQAVYADLHLAGKKCGRNQHCHEHISTVITHAKENQAA